MLASRTNYNASLAVLLSDDAFPFARRALCSREMESLLESSRIGSSREGLHVRSCRLTRHKIGRRFVVEYDVELLRRPFTVMGKARARKLDRNALALHAALSKHLPEGSLVRVPPPVGVLPDVHMLLYERVGGLSSTELLAGDDSLDVAARIAVSLFEFHQLPVATTRTHNWGDELRILEEQLGATAQEIPSLAPRLTRLLRLLAVACPSSPTRACLIHRDFYPDHVLIEGTRTWFIDLDLCCAGDPAIDVGNFAAHLYELGLRYPACAPELRTAAHCFVERYLELADESLRDPVQYATWVSLARHIALSRRLPGRQGATERLLEMCEIYFDLDLTMEHLP